MNPTLHVKTDSLKVPGASLYYEVRGSGPTLLMMPGGPADAAAFSQIAGTLAGHYTVITYDPRGLSHSTLDEPLDDERIVQMFADDVHRLLATVTHEKAIIFANSGGATISLELAARHPEQIRTLVVHEPPSPALLPEPARYRKEMAEVVEIYRTAGFWPATQKLMAMTGIQGGPPPAPQGEPTPEMLEAMANMQRNMDLFFGHYVLAIARYEPDIAALKACTCRIVPAVGDESRGELAHNGGLGLADRLETRAVVFPGAHGGFDSHAPEFAARLTEVLDA
jgi:pimeloyl-ACP methyl ester carboxylesterase